MSDFTKTTIIIAHAWLQRLEAVTKVILLRLCIIKTWSWPSEILRGFISWGPWRKHNPTTAADLVLQLCLGAHHLLLHHCDTLAAPLGAERPSSASLKWLRGSLAYCFQLQLQIHEHLQRQNPLQPWRLHHFAAWLIFQSRLWAGPGWETACITTQPHHTV